jgi:hypothetical protein
MHTPCQVLKQYSQFALMCFAAHLPAGFQFLGMKCLPKLHIGAYIHRIWAALQSIDGMKKSRLPPKEPAPNRQMHAISITPCRAVMRCVD